MTTFQLPFPISPARRVLQRILGGVCLVLAMGIVDRAVAQAPADEATLQRGAAVYQNWCAPCHSAGRGNPGTAALAAKYKNRQPPLPSVLAERNELTPQTIRFFVRQGVSVMAPFRKTEIPDADLDAMIAYLTRGRKP
jgi:mono/diheme cytochrome c family protein